MVFSALTVLVLVQVRENRLRERLRQLQEARRMAEALSPQFEDAGVLAVLQGDAASGPDGRLRSALMLVAQSHLDVRHLYVASRRGEGDYYSLVDSRYAHEEDGLPGFGHTAVLAVLARAYETGMQQASPVYRWGEGRMRSVFIPLGDTMEGPPIALLGVDYHVEGQPVVYVYETAVWLVAALLAFWGAAGALHHFGHDDPAEQGHRKEAGDG